MKIIARSIALATLVVSVVSLAVLTASPVNAETTSSGAAAQGLQISPALVELNAEPGKTYTIKLTVTDVTITDLVYTTAINDFNAKDETGSPQVLLDSALPQSASITSWLTVPQEFTLKSRQSKDIIAQITVPLNAEPGGHYGVLRFAGRVPEVKDTGVGLSASAGTLLLIRVSGDIQEKATLASAYTALDNKQSSFFERSPISFVTRIKNEGNIHIKPVGTIVIHDMFGHVVGTLPVNKEASNVLPSSIRRFDASYQQSWMFGSYSADLTLGYGTSGQVITSTINFWVIPYKLIIVALLVLTTLIFILRTLVKRYNRYIINKASHTHASKTKNHKK